MLSLIVEKLSFVRNQDYIQQMSDILYERL